MARKKKSQGSRRSPDAGSNGSFDGAAVAAWASARDKSMEEAMATMNANTDKPLAVLAREIRDGLRKNGTNVVQNENDPTGDGDQSVIEGKRQRDYHSELFVTGGDLHNCVHPVNTLSPFASAVMTGEVRAVEAMLKLAEGASTSTGNGTPSPDLVALLETRETSMRLSPLLMIVSMGKNLAVPGAGRLGRAMEDPFVAVAKLLLKYGARPDARDVVGKTVFHYGAGAFATSMTLAVADLCLKAQEGGSHLFGKKVTLVNLSNEAMNGQQGIALGFDVHTGRRAVSLPDGNLGRRKKVAVKPENLRLATTDAQEEEQQQQQHQQPESRPLVRLCDIPDRLGSVCFIEIISQDRVDVAKFLLERKARLDVTDCDGVSPLSMAMSQGAQLISEVSRLVNEHATATARRERRKICSCCGKDEKDAGEIFSVCSGCEVMRYCSKECQLQHWKASHKVECRLIQAKKEEMVVLERPPAITGCASVMSVSSAHSSNGPRVSNGDSYRMPQGVRAGQKFTIKVQASGTREAGSLLIYNQARDCSFFVQSGQSGYTELFDAAKAETATNGTKTYVKAMFDEEGNCVAFPGDVRLHTW